MDIPQMHGHPADNCSVDSALPEASQTPLTTASIGCYNSSRVCAALKCCFKRFICSRGDFFFFFLQGIKRVVKQNQSVIGL